MTMTPIHPMWSDFHDRFWDTYETCDSNAHCPTARQVLHELAFTETELNSSLRLFKSLGAHCDCEILLNLDAGVSPSMAGAAR